MASSRASKSSKKIAVIYHADCPDGFGAAWAAWRKLGGSARYVAAHHHSEPPALKGHTIYFVDFVYPPLLMRKLVAANERVVAIDHHASAVDAVKLAQDHVFDNDHSAAVLSWKYFHPGKKVPQLLLHIEDEDIWKFARPRTREIFAFVELAEFDFAEWTTLAALIEKPASRKKVIEIGEQLLRYQKRIVDRVVGEGTEMVRFEGRTVPAVNYPHPLASQIGSALYKKHPPMSIIWSQRKGRIMVSLRSNGSVDVSKIAKKFGGGGHAGAAGFSVPLGKGFPWKLTAKSAKAGTAAKKTKKK